MIKRGTLTVPVIGVAKSGWTLDQFRARAKDSLEQHGGLDPAAWEKLAALLRYIDGDYADASTFDAVRRELGSARHPAYYLAIPPAFFATVVDQLERSGCAAGARIIIEKPFGNNLESAKELNRTLLSGFPESAIFRIDHYLAKGPVRDMVSFRFSNSFLEPLWNRTHIESVQITMAENFGVQGRGAFYDQTGVIRDVVQNHIFQLMCNLAMEPAVLDDSESSRDEKVKVLKAIPPLEAANLVRGQFRGYLDEQGVAAGSKTETFAALSLCVNSWRWEGVPFFIRAGKNLPQTCTEVIARLRRPPATNIVNKQASQNYVRFRISPDMAIAMSVSVASQEDAGKREPVELVASRHHNAQEMEPYERVLTDAITGDPTLFARQDYVEQAWRIVDPVLQSATPVYTYEPGTWGPPEVEARVVPSGGWQTPQA